MLLRFGPAAEAELSRPLLNYSSIAKLTRLPLCTVIDLIKAGVKAKIAMDPIVRTVRQKLSGHHIAYLVNPDTLNE